MIASVCFGSKTDTRHSAKNNFFVPSFWTPSYPGSPIGMPDFGFDPIEAKKNAYPGLTEKHADRLAGAPTWPSAVSTAHRPRSREHARKNYIPLGTPCACDNQSYLVPRPMRLVICASSLARRVLILAAFDLSTPRALSV